MIPASIPGFMFRDTPNLALVGVKRIYSNVPFSVTPAMLK
jgi:hypothetical protein